MNMSDVMEYKCPACDGAMEFDSKSQKLKCPYCDTEISISEFQASPQNEIPEDDTDDEVHWTPRNDDRWTEGDAEGIHVYTCQSCGGEILADQTTGASTCPFCGNHVVMKGQFSGDLKPNFIIPFKLDKKVAKEAYYRHLKGKRFLPKIFRSENHIDEMKGIYVPFWIFEADVKASVHYNAEKTRKWDKQGVEYTEHKYYDVFRSGNITYRNVPANGSSKMEDSLMESIEPYNFSEAVSFNPAYLAGYAADRYDVNTDVCLGRAGQRIQNSAELSFHETVQGYQSVSPSRSSIHLQNTRYCYALYPVWLLNTTWQGRRYIFAMNGQTGKMVGDLPLDKKEFWKYAVTRGLGISAVLCIIQLLMTMM